MSSLPNPWGQRAIQITFEKVGKHPQSNRRHGSKWKACLQEKKLFWKVRFFKHCSKTPVQDPKRSSCRKHGFYAGKAHETRIQRLTFII